MFVLRNVALKKIAFAFPVIASLLFVVSCSAKDGKTTAKEGDKKESSTTTASQPKVRIETNLGNIDLELNAGKAPISVANYLKYVEDKAYDGTIFHRVIQNFMIQGGGFDTKLEKRPVRSMIANESNNGLANVRGTISMARTSSPHSATNQWFINVKDNPNLDAKGPKHGYAVFGKVVAGMDVVEKIRNVQTGSCGMFRRDCPQQQVVIKTIRLLK
ncbi:MAG: peptidyl-prolyl cis-trans isomerase [Deltaproteobacteria bacterium]|nr:peptidyl-prolyl cis-trans isomerase [Deltaproteobacteria bacterium]